MEPKLEELLTVDDVAKILRVSTRTVRRRWNKGEFPAPMRIGRLVRWHPDQIRDYLAKQREECAREGALEEAP